MILLVVVASMALLLVYTSGIGLLEDVEEGEVESQPPHPLGSPPSYDIAMEDQNQPMVPDDAPQGEREGPLGDMDDIEKVGRVGGRKREGRYSS